MLSAGQVFLLSFQHAFHMYISTGVCMPLWNSILTMFSDTHGPKSITEGKKKKHIGLHTNINTEKITLPIYVSVSFQSTQTIWSLTYIFRSVLSYTKDSHSQHPPPYSTQLQLYITVFSLSIHFLLQLFTLGFQQIDRECLHSQSYKAMIALHRTWILECVLRRHHAVYVNMILFMYKGWS